MNILGKTDQLQAEVDYLLDAFKRRYLIDLSSMQYPGYLQIYRTTTRVFQKLRIHPSVHEMTYAKILETLEEVKELRHAKLAGKELDGKSLAS